MKQFMKVCGALLLALVLLTGAALADDAAWREWSQRVLDTFDPACPHTALVAPDDRTSGLDPALVARRFGELAARVAQRHPLSGFVVTGGDGARALTASLQARAIVLTGEVAPGIPLGSLAGGPREGLAIVTKAGGFGSPTALIEAAYAKTGTEIYIKIREKLLKAVTVQMPFYEG